ncbi:MAG: hypothetical protein IT289_12550 [Oligoflexia bacterium]|nr:hypothetical protein [Oligoflexia bacterium]
MFKSVVRAFIFVLALGLSVPLQAAPIKDGPFPMREVVGTWVNRLQGLKIVLSTGVFYSKPNKLEAMIQIYKYGVLMAHGSRLQPLKSKTFSAVIRHRTGYYFPISISAVYDTRASQLVLSGLTMEIRSPLESQPDEFFELERE